MGAHSTVCMYSVGQFSHLHLGRGCLLALLDADRQAVVVLVPVLERVGVNLECAGEVGAAEIRM